MSAVAVGVALLNLGIGAVYVSYGIITGRELILGWRTEGPSHFGIAWVAMAFTCGPHHMEHGLHVLSGRAGGSLDLLVMAVGAPPGIIWFLLRVEAIRGGRGDRVVRPDARWVPWSAAALATGAVGLSVAFTLLPGGYRFGPTYTPNVLLVWLYVMVGYYLLRTQLAQRAESGSWSLSGLSLTGVFFTCASMHATWLAYAATGRYSVDLHGLVIDWLAVPAAAYFLWVVRCLQQGTLPDWNVGRPLSMAT